MTSKNDTMFFPSLRDMVTLAVYLYLVIFLATRLGTLIHEFLGHGMAALILGGKMTSLSIDLFATGYCEYELPQSGLVQRTFVGLAGMAINIISGIAAFFMATNRRWPWEWRMMLCVFAMISVCSQLVYLVTGTYYNHGDPHVFNEVLGSTKWLVWVIALILIAPCTYYFTQTYLRLQHEWSPSHSHKERLLKLFVTLFIASCVYAACYWMEGSTTGFLGGMAASEEKITRIAQQMVEREGLNEAEKAEHIEAVMRNLRPYPIIIPTLLIAFCSGLTAFWTFKTNAPTPGPHHLRRPYLYWNLFLSLLIGGLIIFLQY